MFSGWNCIRILNRFIPFDSSLDGLQLWFWVRCDWTKRSVANRRKVVAGISNFSETGRTFRDGRLWNYFKNHRIIESGFFLYQSTTLWRLYNFAFESKAIGPSLRPQIAGMRPSHVTSSDQLFIDLIHLKTNARSDRLGPKRLSIERPKGYPTTCTSTSFAY